MAARFSIAWALLGGLAVISYALDRIQFWTTGSMLLVLLLTAAFLFWPMVRHVRSEMEKLAEAETRLKSLNETLEQRVAERTAAAEERAKQLEAEIARRERTEEAQRDGDARFRQMADSINGVFRIFDISTRRIAYVSSAYERIWGRSCASLQENSESWIGAVHQDDRPRVTEAWRKAQTDGVFDEEYRIVTPEGAIRWIHDRGFPTRDSSGRLHSISGIGEDVTERRALQAQLVQSQKLEAIGQLAAGIAHEINTPTQYVGDNTRFLRDSFEDMSRLLAQFQKLLDGSKAGPVSGQLLEQVEDARRAADVEYLKEEIPKAIEQSLEGISRIAKIVRAMKDFSHPGVQERVPVDLNQAIETTLTVAHNELKYVADIVTDFEPGLPPVPGHPNEINQAVLNILINAADAIAAATADRPGRKGTIAVRTRRNGEWAEIRISDTGTGIPEKIRSRIFDPFFTTKDVGKGTGQGLALSHSIVVEKHHGTITFETEMGKGTTFLIRLPLQEPRG